MIFSREQIRSMIKHLFVTYNIFTYHLTLEDITDIIYQKTNGHIAPLYYSLLDNTEYETDYGIELEKFTYYSTHKVVSVFMVALVTLLPSIWYGIHEQDSISIGIARGSAMGLRVAT